MQQLGGSIGSQTPQQVVDLVRDKMISGLAEPIADLLPGRVENVLVSSLAESWGRHLVRDLSESLVPELHASLTPLLSQSLEKHMTAPLTSDVIRSTLPLLLKEVNRGVARQISDELVHSFSDPLSGPLRGVDPRRLRSLCLSCASTAAAAAGDDETIPNSSAPNSSNSSSSGGGGDDGGSDGTEQFGFSHNWEDLLRAESPTAQVCMVCRALDTLHRRRSVQAHWYSAYFSEYYSDYYSQALVSKPFHPFPPPLFRIIVNASGDDLISLPFLFSSFPRRVNGPRPPPSLRNWMFSTTGRRSLTRRDTTFPIGRTILPMPPIRRERKPPRQGRT